MNIRDDELSDETLALGIVLAFVIAVGLVLLSQVLP